MQENEDSHLVELRLRILLKNEIRELQHEIDSAHQELVSAKQEIESAHRELANAKAQINVQVADLTRLSLALEGILQSSSWRLTAALRGIHRFVSLRR